MSFPTKQEVFQFFQANGSVELSKFLGDFSSFVNRLQNVTDDHAHLSDFIITLSQETMDNAITELTNRFNSIWSEMPDLSNYPIPEEE